MPHRLIISATITLPDDALASSKIQVAALESGEAFKKAILKVDAAAVYEARAVRVREGDAVPRKKRVAEPETPAATQAANAQRGEG